MKKIITKALCVIFSIGMAITLVLNFFLQIFLDIKGFQETSTENFWQIERIIEENEKELVKIKEDFAEDCIIRARAAAYIVQNDPSVITDREECKLVASLLQVDELHFFNTDGTIYAGTHPEYYGYSVLSGGQIGFFAPMLEDHSLELCQDIMPNSAEEKLMQYAAVWSKDEKEIVQVGLEPERVLKAIEGNDISEIFSMISADTTAVFYAVDAGSGEILGSTDKELVGKNAAEIGLKTEGISEKLSWGLQTINGQKQYYSAKKSDSLLLFKTSQCCELHKGIFGNSLILCIYFVALFMILILSCYIFLERKIVRSIVNINKKLKRIEQGNWDTVLDENSTAEFAELSKYINSMVGSLLNFAGKMSKALEMSRVPIGICEYTPETNRFTATSRVKDILRLSEEEFGRFMEQPELFEAKRRQLCREEACLGDNIFRLDGEPECFIRVESFLYSNSRMIILIDVTEDIKEKRSIAKERDTDLLTGLYNRRAFFSKMELLFGNREQLKNCVMVMIDLDNLKKTNDLYGHAYGDRYLMTFAELLGSMEAVDKVAARMGGDEFILFAYGFEEENGMDGIINKLLSFRGSRKVFMGNGEDLLLEFSMGWAFFPKEGTDCNELIKLADKRMYEDKKRRKDSI